MTSDNRRTPTPNRALGRVDRLCATAGDCIKALAAPKCRRILRAVHRAGEARSPNELAEDFKVPVGQISYHVKVLKECGALGLTDTRPAHGAVEHCYASTVEDNELVVEFLKAAQAEDEAATEAAHQTWGAGA
jgi:predicted transcriptional regulator